MMEFLVRNFLFLWFASMLITPFLAALVSLQSIRSIRKSRKDLPLWARASRKPWFPAILSLFYLLFSLMSRNVVTVLLFFLFGVGLLIAPFRSMFEARYAGFYSNGLIYPNHTYPWSDLEGYMEVPGGIRFIHKQTGAFDIALLKAERDLVMPFLEKVPIPRKK